MGHLFQFEVLQQWIFISEQNFPCLGNFHASHTGAKMFYFDPLSPPPFSFRKCFLLCTTQNCTTDENAGLPHRCSFQQRTPVNSWTKFRCKKKDQKNGTKLTYFLKKKNLKPGMLQAAAGLIIPKACTCTKNGRTHQSSAWGLVWRDPIFYLIWTKFRGFSGHLKFDLQFIFDISLFFLHSCLPQSTFIFCFLSNSRRRSASEGSVRGEDGQGEPCCHLSSFDLSPISFHLLHTRTRDLKTLQELCNNSHSVGS